ncbi:MAG TPA: IclR family transcriptional regulator C-terminal domain-containing protein [Chloroflexota bacterium]|nr:IclR family transcriptional regulator C-terminal domain-containing protein [Chloroflexota bacterium]
MKHEGSDSSPDFVQSLERGLAVIRAFSAEHPELTLSEVARATELTRAAARRFLHTLVDLGYVSKTGRLFALRPRILELGFAYLSSLGLSEVATTHLETLVSTVHESSSVSVLDDDEVVYVARVPTRRIMTVVIGVGTRFPAYATSMGRALLAGQSDEWLQGYLASVRMSQLTQWTIIDPAKLRSELLRVRQQGWAMVDEELEEGLRAIAAPIHDRHGKVIAAVNVSAPTRRGGPDTLRDELLPHLLAAARNIEEDLRAVAPTRGTGG